MITPTGIADVKAIEKDAKGKALKFSVVIPLYNKENSIEATLNSVLAQTWDDYEVLVVNDGSTDHSLAAAERVQSEKIHIISQPNQGVSVARNTGILSAEGEYICFLDADDLWYPDYLETIAGLTEQFSESNLFVTAYRILLPEGKVRFSTQLEPETGCLPSYWLTLENAYDFVWTSAATVRKRALVDAGLFRPGEKVGQDLDMWARVAARNPLVAYSAKVCVDYDRCAEQNARARNKIAYAKAFIRDLEEQLKNPDRTEEEKRAIRHKYDKKQTVYIYTCILNRKRKDAKRALRSWDSRSGLLKFGLYGALLSPQPLLDFVYQMRLKLF